MLTKQKDSTEYYQFNKDRNQKQSQYHLDVVGAVQFERPTYMRYIGLSTNNRYAPSDTIQSAKDMMKLGNYMINPISQKPEMVVLPGTGFGNGHINAQFLTPDHISLESRLHGLGISNIENPKPLPELTKMNFKTIHTNDRNPMLIPPPVRIEKNTASFF